MCVPQLGGHGVRPRLVSGFEMFPMENSGGQLDQNCTRIVRYVPRKFQPRAGIPRDFMNALATMFAPRVNTGDTCNTPVMSLHGYARQARTRFDFHRGREISLLRCRSISSRKYAYTFETQILFWTFAKFEILISYFWRGKRYLNILPRNEPRTKNFCNFAKGMYIKNFIN